MKVGSRVQYVLQFPPDSIISMALSGWRINKLPTLKKQYTIRSIFKCKDCKQDHVLVEELVIGHTDTGTEISTYGFQWKELQPPAENRDEWVDELVDKIVKETKVPVKEPELA